MGDYEAKLQCTDSIPNILGRASGQISGSKTSPTLAQNIDYRIESMKSQIARLEQVKQLLAEPAGMLNVPLEDLRFAMNY